MRTVFAARAAFRCLVLGALLGVLWAGLPARAADEPPPVFTHQASAKDVAEMLESAADTSVAPVFKKVPGSGHFEGTPNQPYRLRAHISGQRLPEHSGPASAQLTAVVGDVGGGTGAPTSCTAKTDKNPAPGPVVLTCEVQNAFHVKEKKPIYIDYGLGSAQGLKVEQVGISVHTGAQSAGVWAFSKMIPALLGLLMVGYWFFFIRR